MSPDGYLERESGALFFTPGMCVILKRYRKVFSLRLRRRALLIASRDLSPKILSKGR